MQLKELMHYLSTCFAGHEDSEIVIKLDQHEFPITNFGHDRSDNDTITIFIQSMSPAMQRKEQEMVKNAQWFDGETGEPIDK